MILHELKALALREGLVDDPAFESKEVRWIIVLDEDGSYTSLRDTLQDVPLPEGKKGKPKKQMSMFAIPRRVIRSSNDVSDFIVDKSEYVLGVEPDGKRSADDLALRHSLYMDLLNEANASLHNKALARVITFLQDSTALTKCIEELNIKEYASNNLFTFRVDGDLLHEDEAIRAWWSARPAPTKKKKKQERTDRQCLICGMEKASADNHNKVQVRGTSGNGAPLVGFNQPAFLKYGLEGNDNAPICRECMTAYVEGLRRLINVRYIDPRTGVAFPPQNVQLTGDTTAVYWANIPNELVGTLSELMYAPQKVRDVLSSPHRGQRSASSAERFFCLIVGGVEGRAMLRSVHTGTLEELEANLEQYFDAIQVRSDESEPLPLIRLLLSTITPDPQRRGDRPTKKEWEKRLLPGLIGKIWLGVLFGDPLPFSVLAAAVTRNKVESNVPDERAALLQLYFVGHGQKERVTMSVDTETPDAPYRLGRLLAAYEDLQYAAHSARSPNSKLNRTLVDRYYGAASTRPNVVFPQIAKLSQSHSRILGRYRSRPEKLIMEIVYPLEGIEFPAMLTIEEQGKFALGFYKQREDIRIKRKERRDLALKRKLAGNGDLATEETISTSEGEINA